MGKKKVSFLVCFNQFPLTREASEQDFKENVLLDPKALVPRCQRPRRKKTLVWPAGLSLAHTQRKLTG